MKENIVVISNGCLNHFPDNRLTHFANLIPPAVYLRTGARIVYVRLTRIFVDVATAPRAPGAPAPDLYIDIDEVDVDFRGDKRLSVVKIPAADVDENDGYLVRRFRHATYVELQERPVQQLTIRLTTADGKLYPLTEGRPTVVEMEITDEPSNDDFVLTFYSHDPRGLELYADNTMVNFACRLPRELNFAGFDVALEEMILPSDFWRHVERRTFRPEYIGRRATLSYITRDGAGHVSWTISEHPEKLEQRANAKLFALGVGLTFQLDPAYDLELRKSTYCHNVANLHTAPAGDNAILINGQCQDILSFSNAHIESWDNLRAALELHPRILEIMDRCKTKLFDYDLREIKIENCAEHPPEGSAVASIIDYNDTSMSGFYNHTANDIIIIVNHVFYAAHEMQNVIRAPNIPVRLLPFSGLGGIGPHVPVRREHPPKFAVSLMHSDVVRPSVIGNQFANILHFVPMRPPTTEISSPEPPDRLFSIERLPEFSFDEDDTGWAEGVGGILYGHSRADDSDEEEENDGADADEGYYYAPEFLDFKPCVAGNIASVRFSINQLDGRPFPLLPKQHRPPTKGVGVAVALRFRQRRSFMHPAMFR